MTPRHGLGELEQLVLLAIMRLGEGAYGVSIRREIAEKAGRSISAGTIYPTLDRLEDKGWIRSWTGEPRASPGGRARRLVALTPAGAEELREALGRLAALAEGFEGWLGG